MPKTYVLECPDNCSLRAGTKIGIKVTEAMLAGQSYRSIIREVGLEGYVLYPGTMSRHKKHIRVTGRTADEENPLESQQANATNIEILETIIQKGFKNSHNWKPTIADTMKAMDMWFRLTAGNPFDDLLNTLASAAIGEEIPEEPEEANPLAISSVDEAQNAEIVEEAVDELAAATL